METSRGDKTICLPFRGIEHYQDCAQDGALMRQALDELFQRHPELFPKDFAAGYTLDDGRYSAKLHLLIRRIELKATREKFSIRPSCVMPYMRGLTDELSGPLMLRHWGVPYSVLALLFGRDESFWYRAEMALGRPSIVGTTVKAPERLPEHLNADEKHTELLDKKVFVPTVAGAGCILGASLSAAADEAALRAAYGEFAHEAQELAPAYRPRSVCTDGWEATQKAFEALFAGICVILCFLHSVLKISKRCARDPRRKLILDKAWSIYHATSRTEFAQRLRRLREWATSHLSGTLQEAVLKLCSKKARFLEAFEHPAAQRTSNAVDRLMNHLDRRLFAMRKLHGTLQSGRLAARAIALQWNFHPYSSRLRCDDSKRRSPFHDLNGFEYHPNWLHNLLIAASMGGRRL